MSDLITVGEGLINDGDYGSPDEDLEDWVTIYGPGDDRSGGDFWDPGLDCAAPEGDKNSEEGQGGTSHGKRNFQSATESIHCLRISLHSFCNDRRSDGILQRHGPQ